MTEPDGKPEDAAKSGAPQGESPDRSTLPDDLPASETPPGSNSRVCLLCGAAMYGVHCKLICPNCGYREDCSDLFPE